jgi:protein-tyrosine phosphatase
LIDLHSHVLWGLDDGAKSLEESRAMLRLAAASGTTDLVATPHANLQFSFDPRRVRERLEELRELADGRVRLYSGCDFHLSYDNIQDALDHPRKFTINQQCYLLVEFSELLVFKNTPEIFGRLQEAGMIPIVTHPERNQLLQQRIDEIAAWVEQGALIQVTAQSLIGDFGRRARDFSGKLLDTGLVHCIASDAHDCQRRPPCLDEALRMVEDRYGKELASRLFVQNPRAIIDGAPLPGDFAAVPRKRRKWYRFW